VQPQRNFCGALPVRFYVHVLLETAVVSVQFRGRGGTGTTVEIRNSIELSALAGQIGTALKTYTLDSVLLGLRRAPSKVEPFMIAGTALFAVRYCPPGLRTVKRTLGWTALGPIVGLVTTYLLADPSSFAVTAPTESSLLSILLRGVGNQFPYADNFTGPGRLLILYEELPKELVLPDGVPQFDLHSKFQELNHVSIADFIKVGFAAFAYLQARDGIARDYFEKARADGVHIPDDETVCRVLDQLAAVPSKLREVYERYKQPDRQFAAYDYNPLFNYPIIRPWEQQCPIAMADDCLTAPMPSLIAWRISTGIYYQMSFHYKSTFNPYFGHLFEAYVGRVLKHCVASSSLVSEREIRQTYPTSRGKVPDWVVIEGDRAILIECKATHLNRKALATGSEEAISMSLSDIRSGLDQLYEFKEACQAGQVDLDVLRACREFIPVLVTSEPFYLANSTSFNNLLHESLRQGVRDMPYRILSIEQLELLQAFVSAGVSMGDTLVRLESESLDAVFRDIERRIGPTYEYTFSREKDREFYARLGVPEE